MTEECLICKAPLVYLDREKTMECAICHKIEPSNTKCTEGHYVCNECHTKGLDTIIEVCMNTRSKDPIRIFEELVALPFCHMHGPEHHTIVGSALLTAYCNAGGNVELMSALVEMQSRGAKVPGGICGFWGACGAAVSAGIFISIIMQATPLSGREWGLANMMTSRALAKIGAIGGPRCCKRNSYTAILEAVSLVREELGIEMETVRPSCKRMTKNNQCLQTRCPYYHT